MLEDEDAEVTSKSARKREAERLQALGRRLSELKPAQLEAFGLPENLLSAIYDHQRFPSREAKRRQLQFVGKLMRSVDVQAIETMLETFDGQSQTAQYVQTQCELWRDRLLNEPDALSEYISRHSDIDRQQLRHLVRRTQSAQDEPQRKSAARMLFRFLHAIETQA
jgi:ribosome-associated protein